MRKQWIEILKKEDWEGAQESIGSLGSDWRLPTTQELAEAHDAKIIKTNGVAWGQERSGQTAFVYNFLTCSEDWGYKEDSEVVFAIRDPEPEEPVDLGCDCTSKSSEACLTCQEIFPVVHTSKLDNTLSINNEGTFGCEACGNLSDFQDICCDNIMSDYSEYIDMDACTTKVHHRY